MFVYMDLKGMSKAVCGHCFLLVQMCMHSVEFSNYVVMVTIDASSNYRLMTCDPPGGADAKSYILISQLPSDLYEKYVVDANTAYMSGFTFVIISIVHLAGGKIPEGMIEVF